jgi:hypothetical protein
VGVQTYDVKGSICRSGVADQFRGSSKVGCQINQDYLRAKLPKLGIERLRRWVRTQIRNDTKDAGLGGGSYELVGQVPVRRNENSSDLYVRGAH